MFYFYFLWLSTGIDWAKINSIDHINSLKANASIYFKEKNYEASLKNLLQVNKKNSEVEVSLNLGKIYLLQNNLKKSELIFKNIKDTKETQVAAEALTQLGYIQTLKKDTSLAINYFKMALRTDPTNLNSRINLELLEKNAMNLKKKEESKYKTTMLNPQLPNQKFQTIADPNAQKTEILKRLNRINMTEENANKILLALSKNEIKYIQQTKKISSEKSKIKQDW